MKRLVLLTVAAIMGLVGLGLIAASQDGESKPLPTQGYFESCFTESGAEIDCSQIEWPE